MNFKTFDSMDLQGYGGNSKRIIFKHMLQIRFVCTSCEVALRCMPQNTFEERSTLVHITWCFQAISDYLSQCWVRAKLPYDITKPQWVNICRVKPIGIWLLFVSLLLLFWYLLASDYLQTKHSLPGASPPKERLANQAQILRHR